MNIFIYSLHDINLFVSFIHILCMYHQIWIVECPINPVSVECEDALRLGSSGDTYGYLGLLSCDTPGLSHGHEVTPGVQWVSIPTWGYIMTLLTQRWQWIWKINVVHCTVPNPECSRDEYVKTKSNFSRVPARYCFLNSAGFQNSQSSTSLSNEKYF